MTRLLAIDIGGTKLAAGIVDRSGALERKQTVPTPATDDPERVWAAVSALVAEVGVAGAEACGVGCGGPMQRGGVAVSPLNIGAWRDFPLRDRLASITGLPTFVDNDAKALALAEGWRGAAAGVSDFIAMVVSTGVGGGIVLDGRLLDGAAGNAGHIGHVIVEPEGEWCRCGARGCLEAMASGPSIERITGRAPALADREVRERTGRLVGRAIADVANLCDLRLAVVGGSVALGFGDDFFGAAQDEVDARARISFARGTRVVRVGLGESGPLIGAGAVGLRGLGVRLLGGDGGGDAGPGAARPAGR